MTQKTEVRFAPGGTDPIWSADGRRVIWRTADIVGGGLRLFSQPSDGTATAEELIGPQLVAPYSAVPDGRRLIVRLDGAETGVDIGMVSLVGERTVTPLIRTPFDERNAEISPDGRWLLYESSESGQPEIYVRPFPAVDTGRWQVSTTGGRWPVWARNGREIFFRALDGAVTGVPIEITAGSSVRIGTAVRLVGPRYLAGGAANREYDVSPDGKRFLMIKEGTGAEDASAPPQLVVVQHFDEELKRLVP
ncbi:MAG: TolB family protein, partial [Vicinamibacterales bacterium]